MSATARATHDDRPGARTHPTRRHVDPASRRHLYPGPRPAAAASIVFAAPVRLCEHLVGLDHPDERGRVDLRSGVGMGVGVQLPYQTPERGRDLLAARRGRHTELLIKVRLLASLHVLHRPPARHVVLTRSKRRLCISPRAGSALNSTAVAQFAPDSGAPRITEPHDSVRIDSGGPSQFSAAPRPPVVAPPTVVSRPTGAACGVRFVPSSSASPCPVFPVSTLSLDAAAAGDIVD